MTLAIAFPNIDPVLLELGPLVIRWYSLAYIAGLLLGWRYMLWMITQPPSTAGRADVDDFLVWAVLAVVIGGRVGYVLFYNPAYYAANPLDALKVWQGGMSFHGGLLGVLTAIVLFCRQRGIEMLKFFDMVAAAAPLGLLLGRIANFINAELYGRPSDVPWAMVFPGAGNAPRHPSQLYEAGLEGLVLFIILWLLWRKESIRRRAGLVAGVFLLGYGAARSFVELFREPDAHIGFMLAGTTMGQWLSLPMWLGGIYLVYRALKAASNNQ